MDKWIRNGIIYQINLRSLAAREPRNAIEATWEEENQVSPLAYVTEHLHVIKGLGVNVLHLMPPYPMGMEDRKGIGSPYASRDYFAVEPEYGTMDEMKAFVRRAHELGFHVIIGMVPNHSSRDNVWTREHPDYYVQDSHGKPVYDLDWSDTAKFDYRNPALRAAMIEVYDFWIGLLGADENGVLQGVDGFRIDMAHFINDPSFWDEALDELRSRHQDREILFLAECYGMKNNLGLFRRGMTATYDDEFYKICEYFYGLDETFTTNILRPARDASHNHDFRDKYQAFKHHGIAGAVERDFLDYEDAYKQADSYYGLVARYTDNHDESRGLYRFGQGAVEAMMRLVFLSPHTLPFMLTGQEFGAMNRPSIHERLQPCDKGRRIRKGRKIVYQEGVEIEGNVFARGIEARRTWYSFYQGLINLRLSQPALIRGEFSILDVGEHCREKKRNIVAFSRTYEGVILHCAVNLGPDSRRMTRAGLFSGEFLYGALDGNSLRAFSAVVVRHH